MKHIKTELKGYTKIAIILAFLAVIGLIFSSFRKLPKKTTYIFYSNQWTQVEFPDDNNRSMNIEMPFNWKFECCGDMFEGSSHRIYPISSDNTFNKTSYITITDYRMIGCPKTGPSDCNPYDGMIEITPNQFMVKESKILENDTAPLFKKTGEIKLSNFTLNALVYKGTTTSNQSTELYLIQSKDGVFSVVFHESQNFDQNFKIEFLNKLTSN